MMTAMTITSVGDELWLMNTCGRFMPDIRISL